MGCATVKILAATEECWVERTGSPSCSRPQESFDFAAWASCFAQHDIINSKGNFEQHIDVRTMVGTSTDR
jgi:hypothetical protein